jgi:hypothetical protein
VRPSNGHVVANPINQFTHEFDGTSWTQLPGGQDQMRQYVEDSLGRLWGIGHYGGLGIFENGGYTLVGSGGYYLRCDPDRPGTVWSYEWGAIVRTDGVYSFTLTPEEVPGVGNFQGLAVGHNGIAWVGASTGTSGALIRIDANTGTHQVWRSDDADWPFPTPFVTPERVTPDGRVWMVYNTDWPFINAGLLWWDGTDVGLFPAPPNGEWQWGGMPHYIVLDTEVKIIPEGYELWMSCASRGIAVLRVELPNPASVDPGIGSPIVALEQNWPNPFRSSTRLGFSIPRAEHVRLAVYDVAGRVVRTLVDGEMVAGRHEIAWDGRDDKNLSLANGLYFYKLDGPSINRQRRMTLLR